MDRKAVEHTTMVCDVRIAERMRRTYGSELVSMGDYHIEEIVTRDGHYIQWSNTFTTVAQAETYLTNLGYDKVSENRYRRF